MTALDALDFVISYHSQRPPLETVLTPRSRPFILTASWREWSFIVRAFEGTVKGQMKEAGQAVTILGNDPGTEAGLFQLSVGFWGTLLRLKFTRT